MIEFKDLPDTSTPITAENLNNNFNELKSYVLYSDLTGSNALITLSDNASNYSYLEILYYGDNRCSSIKVYNPDGKKIDLSCCAVLIANNYYKMSNWEINGNTISFTAGNAYSISRSGFDSLTSDSHDIYIYCVLGYK